MSAATKYRRAIVVLVLVALGPGAALAGPGSSKTDPALASLYGAQADHATQKAAGVRVLDDHVVVDVVADGDVATLEAELVALGMRNVSVFGRMISGELPVAAIPALESIATLRFARPSRPRQSAGPINTQGDAAMRADIARTTFGVSGAGVKVGVISNSFNCLGGAGANVASGELSTVTVVQEIANCAGATDEGRAMLQIVHDVAPGASLLFASGFNGEASFASNIVALKNGGAQIIVDDVAYFDEPMFQDGVVARAVDTVVSQGVAFFSAAGNDARRSYESAFRAGPILAPGTFPSAAGVPRFGGGTAHNFAPSGPSTPMQRITIGAGQTLLISLQWDSPFFSASGPPGSPNDVDVYLLNPAGTQVVAAANGNSAGNDAVETLGYTNRGATADFNLMIVSFGGPLPGFIKYIQLGGSGITIASFDTASGTVFGHAAANGAAAVGAASYRATPVFGVNPPLLETFSSSGPARILFDAAGNRLAAPTVRAKPQFVAPDGVDTTVLRPFFGTSAAAPHAAAVAALMLQQKPELTPDAVSSTLQNTALNMGPAGFDSDTGAGLIQADAAVQAVSTPPDPIAVFLTNLYQSALGRAPDPPGYAFWTDLLHQQCDVTSLTRTLNGFFDSDHFRSRPLTLSGLVTALYRSVLGRDPEPAAVTGWTGFFREYRRQMALSFVGSSEFQSLLPDRTNRTAVTALVTRLYTSLLGRTPAASETNAWVNYILATRDVEGTVSAFVTSPEFEQRSSTFRDFVALLYSAVLARNPGSGEVDFWEGVLRAQLLQALDGSFIPSPEFQGRISQICGS